MVGRRLAMWQVVGVFAVAMATLLLPALPAAAAKAPPTWPSLECGVPVTTNVVLRADLTCSSPVIIDPTAPPVTVDLGRHTLKVEPRPACGAPSPAPPCSLLDNSGRATIINGTVDGDVGSNASTSAERPGTSLTKLHITHTVQTGVDGLMRLSHVVVDEGVGVSSSASIHDSTVRGTVSYSDAFHGIGVDLLRSRLGGVSITKFNDFDWLRGNIVGNDIRGSSGDGIHIDGGGTTSAIALTIERNTITDNAGDGIGYTQGYPYETPATDVSITLTKNIMRRNGGHGAYLYRPGLFGSFRDVALGIVDGGGNRARNNALSPECVGVVCR